MLCDHKISIYSNTTLLDYPPSVRPELVEGLMWFDKLTTNGENFSKCNKVVLVEEK